MVHSCRFEIAKGIICTSTSRLTLIYFHDPEFETTSSFLKLCEPHYRENFGDLELEEKQWRFEIEKETTKLKIAKKHAKVNDSYIGPERSMQIDDLWRSWKNRSKFCSRIFCRKRIMYDMLVFTAVIWNQNGKIKRTLNYCCRDCFQKTKNSCGEYSTSSFQQKTLIDPKARKI